MASQLTPATPPRAKRPRELTSQPSATARSPPRKAPAPQIVFSPGRRVCADGLLHDPSDEVSAFLQQRGYSRTEIDDIMVGGQRTMPAAGARPAEPSRKTRPRPLFADHARKLGGVVGAPGPSGPGGCREPGAAPGLASGSHAAAHQAAAARGDDFDIADLCDILTQPGGPDPAASFLLSQLPDDFQAELAAAVADAERGASQPHSASPAPSAWSCAPAGVGHGALAAPGGAAAGTEAPRCMYEGRGEGQVRAGPAAPSQSIPLDLEEHAFLFQAIGEMEGALMREREERLTQAVSQSQHFIPAGAPSPCRSQTAAFSFSSP